MLSEVIQFFKREKLYTALLFVLLLVYAVYWVKAARLRPLPERGAQVMEQFKAAEKKLQNKLKDKASLEAYTREHPVAALTINLLMMTALLVFLVGLILDLLFLLRPSFRNRFNGLRAPPPFPWEVSLIFKFSIWFFTLNIGFGFLLSAVRKFYGGEETLYLLTHTILAEFAAFAICYVLVQSRGGSFASLGLWNPGSFLKEMKIGGLGYLCVIPAFAVVLIALLALSQALHYEPPPHPLVPILLQEDKGSRFIIYYSMALACFTGPIFEEIFFRGFLYPILKKRVGMWGAMAMTSAGFALIHDNSFAFFPIFVLGMGLNFLYEKRGSLIASMTLHVTHNTVFLGYFFIVKALLGSELGGSL